ncbi:uncharacterized protein [Antedon mediterranea]|uniref:uncharacterized protein n=1 Tax=Antedon mediterranea TaxID=105859 RepID=UPI003AF478A6
MNYGIIARGSYHQGDYRFRELAGKQCVSNSLIAMLYCKIKDGNEFKTFDLDEMLLLGSELYYFIQKDSSMNEELLMVSELPKELHILNNSFEMKYSEGLYGTLEGTDEGAFLYGAKSLGQALEYELCKYDACFMTFYGSTFAIIKRPTGYFIFDSHSRNNEGVLTENGRSVLLYFSSWQGIHKHCLTLAKSMNCPLHATQFDLTGMNVSLKSNKDENEYDLHINASRATNHSEQDTGVDNLFDDIVIDIESHIDKNESFDANKYSKAPTLDENDTLFGNIESHIKENESFETNKCSNPPTLDDSEITYVSTEVITERTDKYFKYLPLQVHSKELLCHKLGIDYNGSNFDTPFDHEHEYITKPTATKKITGDGNCFYRTIAYLISGTERNHSVFRKANVKHMLETNDRFKCTLDTQIYKSVKQYVFMNKLMNSGTWACDTDIISMANMLDRDIYAYNDQTEQWQIFCARKPGYYNEITTERVMKCIKAKYEIPSCINESYLHTCNSECNNECEIAMSSRNCLWICYTCHRKLIKAEIPSEAYTNNLKLQNIPDELETLNNLEQHLIAINIPFMKIMHLPKGGQQGIHGPVVCVPSNTVETVNVLPRPETDDQMIRVKLKRKLSYKGHYEYKYVNKTKVLQALQYLHQNNKWYSDVVVNEEWNNVLPEISQDLDDKSLSENEEQEEDFDSRLSGIQLDTCLQPTDMRQEILDHYFDDIFCCAPCEGNSPVALLNNKSLEGKCFPTLFPTGHSTFHDARNIKLTLGRYFHNKLCHVDNRFAKNTEYIFFAQCLYEIEQVLSSVSIALRKSSGKKDDFTSVKASDFKSASKVQEILKCDRGYKFLKQIRGTCPYWQSTQKDVLAMVRQLGKPTWFASFSSADMRWPEVMKTLLLETGDKRNINELEWADKCTLLKSNPVTVARMFDKRFHNFLRKVILSDAHPIGKVIDYFFRVEYQARGSPHIHMILWVENAPQLGIDENEKVTEFIDKYVSCKIPSLDEDKELHEIVSGVQTHCKRHSKSCKKKGTTCRFNFPKPPSEQTFIIQRKTTDVDNNETENNDTDEKDTAKNEAIKAAKDLLKSVKSALTGEIPYQDTKQLFENLNVTQTDFEDANNLIATKDDFLLQRNPQDAWVNQYNPSLLRAWNANMDLQFVSNEYACVAYVVSYMSKAEREMGLLLSQAETEIKDGNDDAKESLRELGNMYMQNREVSAQESVYRVCNLRLKEGSRKVEFIPVGPNPVRLSLPINVIQNKDDDDEITWLPSKLDKYKSRPDGLNFEKMCLATFCSEYRILSSSEYNGNKKKQNTFRLKNKLGYIQKRTRSNNAVVRYPRFKQHIAPEKYYMSIMQLFLPFRTDQQLKPPSFMAYEDFYEKGSVKLFGEDLQTVSSIVTENMQQFERNADAIEQAQNYIDKYGPPEDAWGLLCPESELDRLENPKPNIENDDEQGENIIPDLGPKEKEPYRLEHTESRISKQESNNMIRCLNDKQQKVFYEIRQWYLNKVNGKQPEPFHVFITGGAGVGKSHLVKCIYNEGTRILGKMMQNPDDVSILKVAPTGIAAYNINGKTIHSALSIPINVSFPYQPLGEEKITQLRNRLGQLQLLIIDEISMVDQKMLCYIHGRLRQIKQVRDDSPFGNVSVLAVGDFFQLPPVKGSSLYKESLQNILWTDNFKQIDLDEIMRQREDAKFANLLNRLRTKEKNQILSNDDLQMLKSRETGEDCEEAIHIYSYNKDVSAWNKKMLHKKCTDIICIEAEDTEMNTKRKDTIRDKPIKKSNQCSLPSYLWVAPNARVMLIKNVDVSKGMTNGCMGNITEIIKPDNNSKPTTIKIKFDNQIDIQSIEKYQESMGKKYSRKQFPLKLAYACTVHKVQGMTMNKAVVNLKNTFLSGQAYVGLSRVTSLSGLYIENFDPKHIRCDPTIKTCLNNMQPFLQPNKPSTVTQFQYCITLHNIQGLRQHLTDLKCNTSFSNSDFICLTETWINDNNISNIGMDNFKLYHQPRCQSYSNDNTITSELKNKGHGGVAVYTRNKYCSRLNINFKDIEFISFMVTSPLSVIITVIYRPPIYDIKKFCKVLENLLEAIHKVGTRCIIMGDFNEDLLKNISHVNNLLARHNYQQLITSSTTEGGTLLDHVYIRNLDTVHTEVIPIYYSYHEIIKIQI